MARILIVEDEFLIAMCIGDELTDAGHDVVGVAADYAGAVDLARRHRPDMAVVDVRLASARDGIEVALTLREELGIPCLLATGSDHPANIARAAAADPLGWLSKPYVPSDLVRLVARVEEGHPSGGKDEFPQKPLGQP